MDRQNPGDLPRLWRERAPVLREYGGDPPAARVWEVAASELEHAVRSFREEALTLVDAARVSGYSADHLGHLVRTGKIPNAGRTNAPLIRRTDLPMKGSSGAPTKAEPEPDRRAAIVLADKLR